MSKTWAGRKLIGLSGLSGLSWLACTALLSFAAAAALAEPVPQAAAVSSIAFVSSPARGDTYELGEMIEVAVEFDRAVKATGRPQVALTIGTETRHATWFRWSSRSLHFEYTVQEGDRDEDGVSIPANALVLNGGTIRTALGLADVDLTHGPVAAKGGRRVNGILGSPPAVTHVHFGDAPARGDTYERGETVRVIVQFDKVVRVTGMPRLALTIGTETRYAEYSTSWRDDLSFIYVVQEGDRDEDGISIPANALSSGGGSITGGDGTTDADLAHTPVGPERDRKVDGSSDVTPPRVRAIYFDSSPARGDTYELGEKIEVVVEFDGAIKATGRPQLELIIGEELQHATISGWGSASLYFNYTVQAGDRDDDGISIPANALSSGGGSITAADGATDADLAHGAVAAEGGRRVNGSLASPPAVTHVSFGDAPARGDTYELRETVRVGVQFDKVVKVTGRPRVALTIGAETRYAEYSTSWRHDLSFIYVVQEGDRDGDGISIPVDALILDGGTITGEDGTTDAHLAHAPVGPERDRKVDGSSDVTPPRVRAIYFDSSPARGDTYELGEKIEVVVEFDRAITEATGRPQLELNIGEESRHATWWDGVAPRCPSTTPCKRRIRMRTASVSRPTHWCSAVASSWPPTGRPTRI